MKIYFNQLVRGAKTKILKDGTGCGYENNSAPKCNYNSRLGSARAIPSDRPHKERIISQFGNFSGAARALAGAGSEISVRSPWRMLTRLADKLSSKFVRWSLFGIEPGLLHRNSAHTCTLAKCVSCTHDSPLPFFAPFLPSPYWSAVKLFVTWLRYSARDAARETCAACLDSIIVDSKDIIRQDPGDSPGAL